MQPLQQWALTTRIIGISSQLRMMTSRSGYGRCRTLNQRTFCVGYEASNSHRTFLLTNSQEAAQTTAASEEHSDIRSCRLNSATADLTNRHYSRARLYAHKYCTGIAPASVVISYKRLIEHRVTTPAV
jgi:hypothetical protein